MANKILFIVVGLIVVVGAIIGILAATGVFKKKNGVATYANLNYRKN